MWERWGWRAARAGGVACLLLLASCASDEAQSGDGEAGNNANNANNTNNANNGPNNTNNANNSNNINHSPNNTNNAPNNPNNDPNNINNNPNNANNDSNNTNNDPNNANNGNNPNNENNTNNGNNANNANNANNDPNNANNTTPDDVTPPQVRIVAPADGGKVLGSVVVELEASDDRALASVVLEVDGQTVTQWQGPPSAWRWDTAGLASGAHTLRAVARDEAGNEASDQLRVILDTPPTVALSPALEPNAVLRGVLALEAQVQDDEGVVRASFFLDGGLVVADVAAPFRAELDSAQFDDGPHALRVQVEDTEGQEAELELTFSSDNTPPLLALLAPTPGALVEVDALRVEVSAADNLGLAELVAEVGGEAYAFELPSTSLEASLEGLPAGPMPVWVQATDRAGNVAEATTVVTLDRPPVVQIVEPAPEASVSGTVTFRAESSDDTPRGPVVWFLDGRPLRAADIDAATWEAPYAYGEHTVEARLSDARGRTAQDARSFTVDHPLSLSLYVCLVGVEFMGEPACGTFSPEQLEGQPLELNGTITFEATPSDDEPLEEVVRLQIDDRAPLVDTSAPFEFSWNTDNEGEGPHTLTFSARNLRGVERLFTVEVVVNRCDLDHDGVPSVACGGGDCDDDDAGRARGLPEVCDLRDNDCDAQIDEGVVLPEGPCGPCGDGAWVCDPLQGQQCRGASPLESCIEEVCADVCEQIAACPGFEQRCAEGEPEAFATACEAECEPLLLQFNLVPDDACGLIQEFALSTGQVRDVCDPPAQRCARACAHQAECLAPICGEAVPSCLEGCLQDPATADGLERQGCLSAQRDLCAESGDDHGCDCALVPPISGIGGPCGVDSDCTDAYGQPVCVTQENQQGMAWVNGYCASVGCNTNDDCGPRGFCYLEPGLGVCLAACDDDAQCRPGYVCGALFGDNTVCGPGCNDERPCPEGLSCDSNATCR